MEGLITQRKQHLQQLDELLNSVFLDMFGDDIRLEDLHQPIPQACDFIDYRGKTPPRVDAGIPLISAKCVRQGYFDSSRLDFILESTYEKVMTRGFPKAGDVLFTTEGATFGFTCRIPDIFEKFAVGQRLITLRCKNGYYPEVLDFMLNNRNIQKRLSARKSGSAALGIRSSELVKIKIPFPDEGKQQKFVGIVNKTEPIMKQVSKSLSEFEVLYSALSQKAFKGELDLNSVPLLAREVGQRQLEKNKKDIVYNEVGSTGDMFSEIYSSDQSQMSSAEGRQKLLQRWFYQFVLNDERNKAPSIDEFWQSAQLQVMGYTEGEDFNEDSEPQNRGFTREDYDKLKDWVFSQIREGKLKQTRNSIMLDGKPDLGNRIVLTES